MAACSPKDEPTPATDKPLIILDTDIGSSTDDLVFSSQEVGQMIEYVPDQVIADIDWTSERGNVVLTPECYTVFTPNEKGNCRYQKPVDEEWAQEILNDIREVAVWHP